jgi:antitoxin (DNA-binding transcriptional repressor) of toxin-antitoxin stability system
MTKSYDLEVKTVTTHQAKTHLSRLIHEVQSGETVVILSGKTPVAQLTAVAAVTVSRPAVGTKTSEPVHCAEDAFAPLSSEELGSWGV